MSPIMIIVGLFVLLSILLVSGIFVRYFGLWIRAALSGAPVSFVSIIGMNLRKVSPGVIVDNYILARRAGVDVTTQQLESHYLAGGNVAQLIQAMIAADAAGLDLSFEGAAAIDLAGEDVLTVIQGHAQQAVSLEMNSE